MEEIKYQYAYDENGQLVSSCSVIIIKQTHKV